MNSRNLRSRSKSKCTKVEQLKCSTCKQIVSASEWNDHKNQHKKKVHYRTIDTISDSSESESESESENESNQKNSVSKTLKKLNPFQKNSSHKRRRAMTTMSELFYCAKWFLILTFFIGIIVLVDYKWDMILKFFEYVGIAIKSFLAFVAARFVNSQIPTPAPTSNSTSTPIEQNDTYTTVGQTPEMLLASAKKAIHQNLVDIQIYAEQIGSSQEFPLCKASCYTELGFDQLEKKLDDIIELLQKAGGDITNYVESIKLQCSRCITQLYQMLGKEVTSTTKDEIETSLAKCVKGQF